MTFLSDPYVHVPPPTDDDYTDGDGHYGTTVALRGELVEAREDTGPEQAVEILPDGYRASDVGNAERLIVEAHGQLRYVHLWQRWVVYTGGRWVPDSADALVTQMAKRVARSLYLLALNTPGEEREHLWKHARKCESSSAITNMIRLARAIPGVIITHEELDARPWLLNVANGTIDLRTGELRGHDPADLLTKQAPVEYDPDAQAPLWDACLRTWQPDETVRDYLQRAIGSGATGHPVEILIVNHGHGGNGKGKFYGAISGVLGPYVVVPDKSLLAKRTHEPHPTVIAALCGARMLIAAETEDGDRLDEAQVKNLTGADQLTGRRMREDPWQFWPSHTAFLHTNNPPRIRGVDNGIWRRVRMIPWDVTIPEPDIDEHLATRLATEAPGILTWIVRGARAWAKDGLSEPEAVRSATDAYRASEDHLGRFLADCCTLDGDRPTSAADLRAAYETWCAASAEDPWTPQGLGRALTKRGLDSVNAGTGRKRHWIGLALISANGQHAGNREDVSAYSVSPGNTGSSRGYTEEALISSHPEHTFPPAEEPAPDLFDPLDEPF